MYNGLLHLHNVMRWVILIFLLITIIQSLSAKNNVPTAGLRKTSLFLLVCAHITLLIGLYQWFASERVGLAILKNMDYDFGSVMKDSFARFWVVEHPIGMLIGIILITIARIRVKRLRHTAASLLYILALIIILASVPWPFRETVARPWLPGMQ